MYSNDSDSLYSQIDDCSQILDCYKETTPVAVAVEIPRDPVELIPLPVSSVQLEVLQKEWNKQIENYPQGHIQPKEKFWRKVKINMQKKSPSRKYPSIVESFYDLLTKN